MERNIMEEVSAKIKLITLDKADAESDSERLDHNLKDFLEEICCRNRMRVECSDHFLNNDLMFIFHENLKSRNPNDVYGTVFFIADMAKNEASRDYLSNIYLICLLVDKMKRERDYFIRLQTCRALANMCYEHSKTQRLIMGQNPLDTIFSLLDLSCTPFRRENCERFQEVVVALILNMLADHQRVVEEIAERHIPSLIRALECDLKHRTPTGICQNIFVAIVSLADVKPPEIIFSLKVCLSVVDMYRRTDVLDYSVPGLEFLEDSELPDITKYQLVEAGIFDVFMWALEHKPDDLAEEDNKKYELLGRVLANILSGDEAMGYVYDINNGEVIDRFSAWLLSQDKDMIHTGALCLGNVARSDSNSVTIVERGLHKNLLHVVKEHRRDVRVLYATVSTLRNLCLPKVNRKELIDDGMVETLLPLLNLEVRTSSPVIYKAMGAVRHTIEDEPDINLRLGTDVNLVRQLVKWSTTTLLPWVSTECTRFLCSLVTTSKDRNVMITMIESKAYLQISRMLIALHGRMQSEALNCMTMTLSAALNEAKREDLTELSDEEKEKSDLLTNFHTVLIECQLADKLKHLIAQHGLKMEQNVLEECLSFLEVAIKSDPVRTHLLSEGFREVFYYVMRNREDYEQIRARIEEMENACRSYQSV